jgi:choline dehydrogenase
VPRGKMLGGSANMNAQIHQWCHPRDFDEWAEGGADGWAWDDVLPSFRAMERLRGPEDGNQLRGRLGAMRVEVPRSESLLPPLWVEAARNCGLNGTASYNGVAYHGAWLTEQAHSNGARFSVYDAYLKPALKRPNLTVMTKRQVQRIILEGGLTKGIELSDGTSHVARRGVILAAGAIASPQLLMLSGIGPAADLRALGIDVALDRPAIGQNLQDHPVFGLKFQLKRPISLKRAGSPWQLLRWLLLRRGLLATSGIDAFAFASVLDPLAPDLELMLAPFEIRDQMREDPQVEAYAIAPAVVKPKSRGRLALRSTDPRDQLSIDFNLFSDAEGADRAVMLAGARLARRIAGSQPLCEETLGEFAETSGIEDDDRLFDALLPTVQTVYHPCGTCRMGSDKGAVLDPRFGVRGIANLWVVDASAMPSVPRGHPNAVVAMMARRAAEFIDG